MQLSVFVVALSLALSASAAPRSFGRADFTLQNGQDAIALNQKFASLSAETPCTAGENACVGTQFAQCANRKFATTPCASGLICAALPLVNSRGTSVTCTTAADRDARIAATGAGSLRRRAGSKPVQDVQRKGKGGAKYKGAAQKSAATVTVKTASDAATVKTASGAATVKTASGAATVKTASDAATVTTSAGTVRSHPLAKTGHDYNGFWLLAAVTVKPGRDGDDPQSSLTLAQGVIATGFANDGQDQSEPDQVPSLTSKNNFINYCLTVKKPLTNGQQIRDGSCNPAPMGEIASADNMPSSKFVSPNNNDRLAAHKTFTIRMAVKNLETGNFVNANQNYFSAPQQLNAQGDIKGHSHVVVEAVPSLTSTSPTDPNQFVFFKGLNAKAQGGILSAEVTGGLPAGVYRLASINTAANHQPALVAIAQHGALDDMVYFTVS